MTVPCRMTRSNAAGCALIAGPSRRTRKRIHFMAAPLYYARSPRLSFPGDSTMRRLVSLVVVAIAAVSCAQTVNVEQEKAALMAVDADWAKSTTDLDKFVS